MMNAGKYKHRIEIYSRQRIIDADGFASEGNVLIANPRAEVKTTSGYTLIANKSDFENALTRFTIRYSDKVMKAYAENNRKITVMFRGKTYSVEYLNNVDEANTEIELQCKAVTK